MRCSNRPTSSSSTKIAGDRCIEGGGETRTGSGGGAPAVGPIAPEHLPDEAAKLAPICTVGPSRPSAGPRQWPASRRRTTGIRRIGTWETRRAIPPQRAGCRCPLPPGNPVDQPRGCGGGCDGTVTSNRPATCALRPGNERIAHGSPVRAPSEGGAEQSCAAPVNDRTLSTSTPGAPVVSASGVVVDMRTQPAPASQSPFPRSDSMAGLTYAGRTSRAGRHRH
jgi:hypothetical protein